ncbi:MAG: HD domain-containing protein [Bacteroidota bacterium]
MNYQAAKDFILEKLRTELADELYYHGLHHTLDVLAVTEELAELLDIAPHERVLLRTAALYHDAGFTVSATEHELRGCEIARAHLPGFGYRPADIERICGMITATKIPQSPQNQLEEILCDADLDYLGRDDFYPIGATLFDELHARKVITQR